MIEYRNLPIPFRLERGTYKFTYPMILVGTLKHWSDYYIVKSKNDLYKISLQILKERIKTEFDVYSDKEEKDLEQKLKALECDRTSITSSVLIGDINAYIRTAKCRLDDVRTARTLYIKAKLAIKNKDGKLAYQILYDTNDHEYNLLELIQPKEI